MHLLLVHQSSSRKAPRGLPSPSGLWLRTTFRSLSQAGWFSNHLRRRVRKACHARGLVASCLFRPRRFPTAAKISSGSVFPFSLFLNEADWQREQRIASIELTRAISSAESCGCLAQYHLSAVLQAKKVERGWSSAA